MGAEGAEIAAGELPGGQGCGRKKARSRLDESSAVERACRLQALSAVVFAQQRVIQLGITQNADHFIAFLQDQFVTGLVADL